MDSLNSKQSYLLRQFYDFYLFFIKQRDKAMGPYTNRFVHEINRDLSNLLEAQKSEIHSRGGDYWAGMYEQSQYVMAALADEIFLHMDWEGRDEWRDNLLEYRLFKSKEAGEKFFRDLKKLLADGNPALLDMATVYHQALSLGFKGKHRGGDGAKLDFYRKRLHTFIFQREATWLDETEYILPDAHEKLADQGTGEKLPYLGRWIFIIIVLIVLYVGISDYIWRDLTKELTVITDLILKK